MSKHFRHYSTICVEWITARGVATNHQTPTSYVLLWKPEKTSEKELKWFQELRAVVPSSCMSECAKKRPRS